MTYELGKYKFAAIQTHNNIVKVYSLPVVVTMRAAILLLLFLAVIHLNQSLSVREGECMAWK